ncbi:hypothetical protein CY35_07G023900 [Sphagnum magellanicum]|uniref:Uncharacterized protein n=1 Tax=Sphagnum magellanicum TaxID=128215 RepID=A0ACB8HJI6_9BRYO|nr:hypothetical protein CY35_07G023900 [Sphagnum magellanicum]
MAYTSRPPPPPGLMGDNLTIMTSMPLQEPQEVGLDDVALAPGQSRKKDDRIPQWGYHETKEFIAIRAELEKDFTQTKRNKTLWELIAGKMKEKGFRRSADQCKCKWKNLVNRYKGKETSEPDNGRQCPFFEELDAIFKERAKNMDRLMLESETGFRKRTKQGKFSDEDNDEEYNDEEDSEDERAVRRKKRKSDKEKQRQTADRCRASSMKEVLDDFFQHQQKIQEQWRYAAQKRQQERLYRELEWKESMEKLEQQRRAQEHAWREHEEMRRVREEARAEKRDALFAALINKFFQENGS